MGDQCGPRGRLGVPGYHVDDPCFKRLRAFMHVFRSFLMKRKFIPKFHCCTVFLNDFTLNVKWLITRTVLTLTLPRGQRKTSPTLGESVWVKPVVRLLRFTSNHAERFAHVTQPRSIPSQGNDAAWEKPEEYEQTLIYSVSVYVKSGRS